MSTNLLDIANINDYIPCHRISLTHDVSTLSPHRSRKDALASVRRAHERRGSAREVRGDPMG